MSAVRGVAQAASKLRIGIIGAGGNTKLHHIPKLQAIPGVEVVAIANRTAESAAKAGEPFGITKATGNWRDIIDDTAIDAVVIGTWPYLHRTLVLEAFRAGKHVLTEARLAMNAAEARELYQESLRHPHLVTQVVPSPITFRYDATIQDIIRQGTLGDLIYVEVKGLSGTFADPEGSKLTWRTDMRYSGLNIGVMGIFYEPLQRWLGEALSVSAKAKFVVKVRTDGETGEPVAVRIPDHIDILADLAIGAQAHFVFSSVIGAVPGQLKGYTLYGKEGTLHLDLDAGKLLLGLKSEGGHLKEVSIESEKSGAWRVEEEFVGAIRGTEKIQRTTFEQGVRYMEFTEAVTRSFQSGCTVRLPLVS
ncbi:g2350 [Coccomyxa elongata]